MPDPSKQQIKRRYLYTLVVRREREERKNINN
jgi:hypothetical protein